MPNRTCKKLIIIALLFALWAEIEATASQHDYYAILGVSQSASEEEIKKSFRKLCRQYHPQFGHPDGEKIRAIIEAYSCLKNEAKRKEYDNLNSGSSFTNFDFDRPGSEFQVVWFMSLKGTGYKFSTHLDEFDLEDMLNRTGKYDRFLSWFSQFIQKEVVRKHKDPYHIYFETPLYLRWWTAQNLPTIGKLAIPFALFAPFLASPEHQIASYFLPPMALGVFEFWTKFALHDSFNKAKELGAELERIVHSLQPQTRQAEHSIKLALLSYDLVELMGQTYFNLQEQVWLNHNRKSKIGQPFSLFYQGWLLRSVRQSRPDLVNKALLADVKAHRGLWESELRKLEAAGQGVLQPDFFVQIRKTLELQQPAGLLSRATAIYWQVASKAHLFCEKILQGF